VGFALDVSAYRDRPLECPRCRIELDRNETREVWKCKRCTGSLVGTAELIAALVKIAPELVAKEAHLSGVAMVPRRSVDIVPCSICGGDLDPAFLGGVDIDHCTVDHVVWFDRGELGLVLDSARRQHAGHAQPWFARLVSSLFGNDWPGQ
jgi:Zn-finger nucleic acid-binding protein